MSASLLKIENLSVLYPIAGKGLFGSGKQALQAVRNISFEINPGETLGIVGETGCGKSSLGRAILQLVKPNAGRVLYKGRNLCQLNGNELVAIRKELQVVFQDPLSSLNPRMTVGEIIAEPLRIHSPDMTARQRDQTAANMMERVGLQSALAKRYPNEFSGGQCQRVSIARAMILQPKIIICDEPVSALDVSIQAQICNLLRDLQRDTGVAMLFISHDLSVVRYMAHRILVMYLGQAVELSTRDEFFKAPKHPYSQALLKAVPRPDPGLNVLESIQALEGELPSPMNPPSGCVFRTRCPKATAQCISQTPVNKQTVTGDMVACHYT